MVFVKKNQTKKKLAIYRLYKSVNPSFCEEKITKWKLAIYRLWKSVNEGFLEFCQITDLWSL